MSTILNLFSFFFLIFSSIPIYNHFSLQPNSYTLFYINLCFDILALSYTFHHFFFHFILFFFLFFLGLAFFSGNNGIMWQFLLTPNFVRLFILYLHLLHLSLLPFFLFIYFDYYCTLINVARKWFGRCRRNGKRQHFLLFSLYNDDDFRLIW